MPTRTRVRIAVSYHKSFAGPINCRGWPRLASSPTWAAQPREGCFQLSARHERNLLSLTRPREPRTAIGATRAAIYGRTYGNGAPGATAGSSSRAKRACPGAPPLPCVPQRRHEKSPAFRQDDASAVITVSRQQRGVNFVLRLPPLGSRQEYANAIAIRNSRAPLDVLSSGGATSCSQGRKALESVGPVKRKPREGRRRSCREGDVAPRGLCHDLSKRNQELTLLATRLGPSGAMN